MSAMVKSGKYYKWPTSEDCIFHPVNNVIMKLQPSTVKSARGTSEFTVTKHRDSVKTSY